MRKDRPSNMTLAATAAEQFVHQIGTGTVVHNSGASKATLLFVVWPLEPLA